MIIYHVVPYNCSFFLLLFGIPLGKYTKTYLSFLLLSARLPPGVYNIFPIPNNAAINILIQDFFEVHS